MGLISPDRLVIETARVSYCGRGRPLDITRGTGRGIALAFAPSTPLLSEALAVREEIRVLEQRARGLPAGQDGEELRLAFQARGEAREAALWEAYAPQYRAEMRVSSGLCRPGHRRWGELEEAAKGRGVRPWPAAWWGLAALPRPLGASLVLTCWCGPRHAALRHCHRFLLAEILVALGAEYLGEAPAFEQPELTGRWISDYRKRRQRA